MSDPDPMYGLWFSKRKIIIKILYEFLNTKGSLNGSMKGNRMFIVADPDYLKASDP